MWPFEPRDRLSFDERTWRLLIEALEERGEGRRESGAFLLAEPGSRRIEEFALFDDLDPNCLTGGIAMKSVAFSNLWDICDETGLRVIADVHTHPGRRVAQSAIDQDNPTIGHAGHIALIVPSYASGHPETRDVGLHVLKRDGTWRSSFGRRSARRLQVESAR